MIHLPLQVLVVWTHLAELPLSIICLRRKRLAPPPLLVQAFFARAYGLHLLADGHFVVREGLQCVGEMEVEGTRR